MDVNQFLHAMPEVAQEQILKTGLAEAPIGDGVSRLMISGHHRGLPYRFQVVQEYDPVKSEELGIEVFKDVEVCFRKIDRKNDIPMRIPQDCPPELLRFDKKTGECVGGAWHDNYIAWKQGRKMPGLSLRKWEVLTDAEVSSLEADGIWTVEQFAEYPAERISSRYPQTFVDAHKRACQFMAGKEMRERAVEQAAQMEALVRQNAEMAEKLLKLEQALAERPAPKGKRKTEDDSEKN